MGKPHSFNWQDFTPKQREVLEELERARQSLDFNLILTGTLPVILMSAALLAFPVSFLLLRWYRRAVLQSMAHRTGGAEASYPTDAAPAPSSPQPAALLRIITLPENDAFPLTPEAQAHRNRAFYAPWRAAAVYCLGGVCFAGIMAAAFLAATSVPFLSMRFLIVAWIYGWPLLLTFGLVVGSTARTRLRLALAYFGGFVVLGAVGLALSSKLSVQDICFLWLTPNALPTALVMAYLIRRVRAVSPMVLTFLFMAITGVLGLGFGLVINAAKIADFGISLGLSERGVMLGHIGLIVTGLAAFAALGWLLLQWIRTGYESKKISDQSLTLDSLWLFFGIAYSIELASLGVGWIASGLIAFLAYKIAGAIGFSLAQSAVGGQGVRLLLLRVFALGKRSEKLFDAFGSHWRYLGPIQMIAGPDLATTTIAPHEFLEFLTGKLARRFISNPETLERRLSEMDLQPDRDWRFRVNDFFCFADTWKMVLDRLVLESDAVLMDLRSFSRERAGCIFEISELINTVSLDRAVFIIDATTDEPFLRQTIQQAWNDLRPSSPNYDSPNPRLRLFHYAGAIVAGRLRCGGSGFNHRPIIGRSSLRL